MDKSILTINDLARRLGVARSTLVKWRHNGKGPRSYQNIEAKGSPILYTIEDVEAWEAERSGVNFNTLHILCPSIKNVIWREPNKFKHWNHYEQKVCATECVFISMDSTTCYPALFCQGTKRLDDRLTHRQIFSLIKKAKKIVFHTSDLDRSPMMYWLVKWENPHKEVLCLDVTMDHPEGLNNLILHIQNTD